MMIDLKNLPQERLQKMARAAQIVAETMRVLQKSETNVVGEILKTAENFVEWEHLPPKDAYDNHSHSQYYYHAHSKSEDGSSLHDDEHGHFHTFIRGKGFPDNVQPLPLDNYTPDMDIKDVNSHLVGIGMNTLGVPIRLFTVNRWVTDETWCKAEDVVTLLDHYELDDVRPSWPVNLWITNMMALYQPHIEALLKQRDAAIETWQADHPDCENVYEDRGLEVTSYLDINLLEDITALEAV